MMRGDSKRVDILREIYTAVGDKPFRARDVPVNSYKLAGMGLDGMLDRIKIDRDLPRGHGSTAVTWRISEDALCVLRGEKINREQSRRQMRRDSRWRSWYPERQTMEKTHGRVLRMTLDIVLPPGSTEADELRAETEICVGVGEMVEKRGYSYESVSARPMWRQK